MFGSMLKTQPNEAKLCHKCRGPRNDNILNPICANQNNLKKCEDNTNFHSVSAQTESETENTQVNLPEQKSDNKREIPAISEFELIRYPIIKKINISATSLLKSYPISLVNEKEKVDFTLDINFEEGTIYLTKVGQDYVILKHKISVYLNEKEIFSASACYRQYGPGALSWGWKTLEKNNFGDMLNKKTENITVRPSTDRIYCVLYVKFLNKSNDFFSTNYNFTNMYTQTDFHDLTIVVGDKKLTAHKFMLANHSNILYEMIKKCENNTIVLNDEFNAVKYTIRYMYCGQSANIPNDPKNVDYLLNCFVFCHKYEITLGKQFFAIKIQENTTCDNIICILKVFHEGGLTELTKHYEELYTVNKLKINISNDELESFDTNFLKYLLKLKFA